MLPHIPALVYQINPVQTEKLYSIAIEMAGLTGKELVLDAYCGVGTIGLVRRRQGRSGARVELNRDAVKDAIINAKLNGIKTAGSQPATRESIWKRCLPAQAA